MVKVGGMTLVERTLRLLAYSGIDEIAIIVNEAMAEVARHVEAIDLPLPVRIVVKSTESSMHSLHALSPHLLKDRFILATVDSIILRQEAADFVQHFVSHPEVDVLLSYTDFVDDEKPLRIDVSADGRVVGLGARAQASTFVTVGLYGMNPTVVPLLNENVKSQMSRLRNFLGLLQQRGATMSGYRLSKAIDVDRPEDIEAAEAYLREQGESQWS